MRSKSRRYRQRRTFRLRSFDEYFLRNLFQNSCQLGDVGERCCSQRALSRSLREGQGAGEHKITLGRSTGRRRHLASQLVGSEHPLSDRWSSGYSCIVAVRLGRGRHIKLTTHQRCLPPKNRGARRWFYSVAGRGIFAHKYV